MKKIIPILLFFMVVPMFGQSNNKNIEAIYQSLGERSLSFVEIPQDSIDCVNGKNSDLFKISNYDVAYIASRNFNPDAMVRDTLVYFGCKISVDKLLGEDPNNEEETLHLNIASVFTFSFNKEDYLSIFAWDASIPTSIPNYYVFLMNLSRKDVPLLLGAQASYNPLCFTNNETNNTLTYWDWDANCDSYISKYHINNGVVLPDTWKEYWVSCNNSGGYQLKKLKNNCSNFDIF